MSTHRILTLILYLLSISGISQEKQKRTTLQISTKLVKVEENRSLKQITPKNNNWFEALTSEELTIISEAKLLLTDGEELHKEEKGQKLSVLSYFNDLEPHDCNINLKWTYKDQERKLSLNTNFYCKANHKIILQVESRAFRKSNLFLVITTNFLNKGVTRVTEDINHEKDINITRTYNLSSPNGNKETFLNYFKKNGINFTENEKFEWQQHSMQLTISCKVSKQTKIQQLLNRIGIIPNSAKTCLTIIEIDNKSIRQETSVTDLKNNQHVKTLANFEAYLQCDSREYTFKSSLFADKTSTLSWTMSINDKGYILWKALPEVGIVNQILTIEQMKESVIKF